MAPSLQVGVRSSIFHRFYAPVRVLSLYIHTYHRCCRFEYSGYPDLRAPRGKPKQALLISFEPRTPLYTNPT